MERFRQIIEHTKAGEKPAIHFIRRVGNLSPTATPRLGIFAASFNPVTTAHIELMRRAKIEFALDEMLALASTANADKRDYECSLDDRLQMLELALPDDAQTTIGLASHAFFVDLLDALAEHFTAQTELHFILGFDTFERLLDRQDQYTRLYYRKFSHRLEALDYLLSRSRLIIAGRAGANHKDVYALASQLPQRLSQRLAYLDFPDDLAEQSATAVRLRVRQGLPIEGLVPESVARYIAAHGLYALRPR